MSAALTVDRKKYVRLANRIVVKAIESRARFTREFGSYCVPFT